MSLPANKTFAKTLLLLSLLSGSLFLCACNIEQDPQEDALVSDIIEREAPDPDDKVAVFKDKCYDCIEGNITGLQNLIDEYGSTFTSGVEFTEDSFLLQNISPTIIFERCAQKAASLGDSTALYNKMTRPNRMAKAARYFYIKKDYTTGGFWLRRLINTRGERDGMLIAGRVFIQDLRSFADGTKMLKRSAELGNKDASTILLSLLQPGSIYYQTLTQNSIEDEGENKATEENKVGKKNGEKTEKAKASSSASDNKSSEKQLNTQDHSLSSGSADARKELNEARQRHADRLKALQEKADNTEQEVKSSAQQ